VCSECEHSEAHRIECELIRSWKLKNENKYSKHLFRALTVIRGLLLPSDDTKLMLMMACHENSDIQNKEVDKILDEFDGLTEDSEEVTKLKKISSILNTNAFELGLSHDEQPEHGISLRVSKYKNTNSCPFREFCLSFFLFWLSILNLLIFSFSFVLWHREKLF
jgi:hypothetical protein